MSRRTSEPSPFWQQTPKQQPRLQGTWPDLVGRTGAALDGAVVPGYDRSARYELGGLIDHPAFGVGVVVGLPRVGVMEVRFAGQDKLLACGSRP